MSRVLANLNLNGVTSNRLMTKAVGFIDLENYNGATISDSTDVDIDKFGWLYASVVMSQTTATNTLPNPLTLYSDVTVPTNAPMPLVLLAQRYHYILPNAVSDNLLRIENGQLYDVAGRTQSPFGEGTIFAVVTFWAKP